MVKEAYYDNLRMIEAETDKVLLSKTDVAKILKISRTTVIKKYNLFFKDGYITKAVLARILTK